jgi:hypothetical protein
MKRLAVGLLSLTFLSAPLLVQSQPVARMPHVGVLLIASPEHHPLARAAFDNFRQGLRERGYVEGQTIVIEPRFQSEKRTSPRSASMAEWFPPREEMAYRCRTSTSAHLTAFSGL